MYLHWHSWAETMSKTHAQIRCPQCGLFTIWLPKAEAREINRKDEAERQRIIRATELRYGKGGAA